MRGLSKGSWVMLSDDERYMEWLRAGEFTNITARVNAAFAIMEQEGMTAWPRLATLPEQHPSDPEVWSWVEG
jgi:hypothetical protein